MATLIVKADVKLFLDQIGTEYDSLLDVICTEVQDMIELDLGFTFGGYTSATTVTAYGNGTPWLILPPHQAGTITSVYAEPHSGGTGTNIVGWAEQPNGNLYFSGYYPGGYGFGPYRYTVTGNFGYGTAWPAAVKEVATEVAVNIFKERTKGAFSDVIGVEGSGGEVVAAYKGAFTKRQRYVLDMTRRKYKPMMVA